MALEHRAYTQLAGIGEVHERDWSRAHGHPGSEVVGGAEGVEVGIKNKNFKKEIAAINVIEKS